MAILAKQVAKILFTESNDSVRLVKDKYWIILPGIFMIRVLGLWHEYVVKAD